MLKKQLLALILVLAVLLCCGCSSDPDVKTKPTQSTQPSQPEEEQSAGNAPDFTVYDMDGNPVKLSEMTGKPVVFNIWATWCPPCKEELPSFQRAYELYGDQVHFMMIDLTQGRTETKEMATQYVQQNEFTFPLYFDLDETMLTAYPTDGIPFTGLVDAKGNLVETHVGMMDFETLEAYIQSIL